MSQVRKLLENLERIEELGKSLDKARKYLENHSDVLAEHLFKLFYYKVVRKNDINGWKQTVIRVVSELIKNHTDKSNKLSNYSEGELLIALWDEPLSGVQELKNIQEFLINSKDKKGRIYPSIEIEKSDPLIFKSFISKMIEGILIGKIILDWEILGL